MKKINSPVLVAFALLGALIGPIGIFSASDWQLLGWLSLFGSFFLFFCIAKRPIAFLVGLLLFMLYVSMLIFFVTPWWYSLHGERVDGCVLVDSEYRSGGRRSPSYYDYRFQCGDRVLESTSKSVKSVEVGDTVSLLVDSTGLLPAVAPVPNEENAPYGPYALGAYYLLSMGSVLVAARLPEPVDRPKPKPKRRPAGPLNGDFL
ncbi:hypothetical protein [Actinosynnema pretiosum]|uniref:Uncharacterized protein n=1 Tax=Actinosynnema pretiosum TaxID=42197 RepID=A0A290ZDR8_9PSEU|nr:hypothetical protein [Actinosynnema pretiosum]ATE57158.1 hypothetical protein CNX65_30895 [Actinosynnema pretiosum]